MNETSFVVANEAGWPIRGDVRWDSSLPQERLIIISHGFKGFKDWGFFPYVARRLSVQGFTTVAFNFSGSGIGEKPLEFTEAGRFAENTFSREIADLTLVLDHALSGRISGIPMKFERGPALLGHSRGGLDSIVVAEQSGKVDRVITWAGIGSLHKRFDDLTRAGWRARGFLEVVNARTGQIFQVGLKALDDLEQNFERYDPLRLAPKLEMPLLMVHGTADTTIPIEEARELYRATHPGQAKLVEIVGAGHTFNAVHPFAGTTEPLEAALKATSLFLKQDSV